MTLALLPVVDVADGQAVRDLGVEGVIAGKALYAGAFTVAEALAALANP